MALTCGFFNSINKDRLYDAIQFGQIFDGIIADGVYATYLKGMVVIASDNPNEVIIQPGRAWFNHTWSYNDANLPFEAPEPEVLLDRIDTLVLDVNLEQAERNNTYIWVQGTPSSQNPQPPALIRSVTHNQYPLCDVYRKAGTTMIYTKDITNRIGTSDTPFATGVLEGIDLDMWINQWDNEFHTWEIDTKAEFDAWELNSKNSFETWMISQQQVYTAWFNSIKDQMSDDLAEFEAWFDTIKDIIDQSAALHLQAEIDEINKMLPSGSHITITTENTELFGRNVTVTDGTHPTTVKFDNSGVAEVETYPYVGNITITSTDGIRTATTTTHIPYFGRYSYGISFWAAVVNIIGDEEFATYPVTVKNSNGDILTTIILDSSAQGTWTAIEPDTYTFSVTYGGETMEVSLNVTQETTYTVEIHAQSAGFDFEEWLTAGDVSGTYADLDAVLADEVAVRKLMTKHASVDYLASFTDEDESVIKILNNDLCAKWISLRDYAMDILEEAYGTLMASIGKYGYGEWALEMVDAVPTMTSNTTPSGEVISGGLYNSTNAYKAFDGSDSTSADGAPSSGSLYIGYDFGSPVVIYKASILLGNYYGRFYGFKAQGTNDLSEPWTDLSAEHTITQNTLYTFDFTTTGSYRYYRIIGTNQANAIIKTIQFIKGVWQPKGAVPIMTGNTAPYGEASASSIYSTGYEAYRAFDGSLSTIWHSSGTSATQYVRYKFTNPVYVKKASVYCTTDTDRMATAILQGSNDGSTWVDVSEDVKSSLVSGWNDIPVTKNGGYYLYYQINFGTCISVHISELQFYGRQMTVSVPTMTGNTSPYGEAFGSSRGNVVSNVAQYYEVMGEPATQKGWLPTTNAVNNYIGYTFPSPVNACVFMFKMNPYGTASRISNKPFKVQGFDGTDWIDIDSFFVTENSGDVLKIVENDDGISYSGYRLFFADAMVTGSTDRIGVANFKVFGKDYSERDWDTEHPRHYIYDHGLEFETLTSDGYTVSGSAVTAPEKQSSQLYFPATNNSSAYKVIGLASALDTTPYSLERICVGDKATEASGVYGYLLAATSKTGSSSVATSSLALVPTLAYPYQIGLDVLNINQSMYHSIASGYYTRSLTITEWWLE